MLNSNKQFQKPKPTTHMPTQANAEHELQHQQEEPLQQTYKSPDFVKTNQKKDTRKQEKGSSEKKDTLKDLILDYDQEIEEIKILYNKTVVYYRKSTDNRSLTQTKIPGSIFKYSREPHQLLIKFKDGESITQHLRPSKHINIIIRTPKARNAKEKDAFKGVTAQEYRDQISTNWSKVRTSFSNYWAALHSFHTLMSQSNPNTPKAKSFSAVFMDQSTKHVFEKIKAAVTGPLATQATAIFPQFKAVQSFFEGVKKEYDGNIKKAKQDPNLVLEKQLTKAFVRNNRLITNARDAFDAVTDDNQLNKLTTDFEVLYEKDQMSLMQQAVAQQKELNQRLATTHSYEGFFQQLCEEWINHTKSTKPKDYNMVQGYVQIHIDWEWRNVFFSEIYAPWAEKFKQDLLENSVNKAFDLTYFKVNKRVRWVGAPTYLYKLDADNNIVNSNIPPHRKAKFEAHLKQEGFPTIKKFGENK